LAEEDPLETPHQRLSDDHVTLHANIPVGTAKFEAIGGFQKSRREEFESADTPEGEQALNLLTKTSTLDLKAHHPALGLLKGTIGVSAVDQDFETLGLEALIPSYQQKALGGYIYEELPIGKLTFNAGLRGDTQKYDIEENTDLAIEAQTRKYNQTTGAVGAVWHAAEPLAFAVNVGRGYRAPVPFELFVHGEHEGTGRFEIGDPNLKPEKSTNVDLATRYASKRIKGEVAVFRNKISDYIFAQPLGTTSDPDNVDLLPEFQMTQANAILTGGEISLEALATEWLVLNAAYDVVRGKNDQTDEDLPLIPADRFKAGVRFQTKQLGSLFDRSYIGGGARVYRKQDRVDPNETVTPGYTLWDVSAGTEIKVAESHLNLDIGIENIGDKEYVDHLSRNKNVGILNPGRNIFVKASMPFGLVK
jgi:iron complex outermembrane receptor protein